MKVMNIKEKHGFSSLVNIWARTKQHALTTIHSRIVLPSIASSVVVVLLI